MTQEAIFFIVGVVVTLAAQVLGQVVSHLLAIRRKKLEEERESKLQEQSPAEIAPATSPRRWLKSNPILIIFPFILLTLICVWRILSVVGFPSSSEIVFIGFGVIAGLLMFYLTRILLQ